MNAHNFRHYFPIFNIKEPYIYLDSAATAHKPHCVINRMRDFYAHENAPIHRGSYRSGEQATQLYEQARTNIAATLGALAQEIIFTPGTTAGINAIASTYGRQTTKPGDEIIVSAMEHHSNILPWQWLARECGAQLVIAPCTTTGLFDLDAYKKLLSTKTKIVAITHASNVLGTINDIAAITQLAHTVGAVVVIDAAQSASHQKLNIQKLGVDFLAFSGHKALGPTGIGVLYVNKKFHDMQPYQLGGGMVQNATSTPPEWLPAPHRFEAGTPPIAQAIGLEQALYFLEHEIGWQTLRRHEQQLMHYTLQELQTIARIRILGEVEHLKEYGHLISFIVDGIHAHDVAAALDEQTPRIAVRAGQQCAQYLHEHLGISASVRISFHCYNTREDVELVIAGLKKLCQKT